MFEFRIIICADGTEIIDRSLKTPYSSLTPLQMLEYTELDEKLSIMDRMERKSKKEAERQRKISQNLFYKMGCLFGLI
jgi:hypothetical protein